MIYLQTIQDLLYLGKIKDSVPVFEKYICGTPNNGLHCPKCYTVVGNMKI